MWLNLSLKLLKLTASSLLEFVMVFKKVNDWILTLNQFLEAVSHFTNLQFYLIIQNLNKNKD